jgi:hypothetical protein
MNISIGRAVFFCLETWKCIYSLSWIILWNVTELLHGVSENKMEFKVYGNWKKCGFNSASP